VVWAAAESGRHATANAAASQPAREERASMGADSTHEGAGPHNFWRGGGVNRRKLCDVPVQTRAPARVSRSRCRRRAWSDGRASGRGRNHAEVE
jgi:hypothetical protein